jgi:hypothetical protein
MHSTLTYLTCFVYKFKIVRSEDVLIASEGAIFLETVDRNFSCASFHITSAEELADLIDGYNTLSGMLHCSTS